MKNSITILTTAVASLFVATAPIVASADHVPFRGVVEGFYGRPWGTYGLEKCKIAGLVSNPMENCEANKIALYGFAKWCANPDSFDSKKCWDESFAKLYPDPNVAHAMRVFAEHNSDIGSDGCYSREESVSCAPLCAKAMEELDKSRALSDETAKGLRELIKEVHIACMALKIRLPKGRYDLGWDIEGWLDDELHLMEQAVIALVMVNPSMRADGTGGNEPEIDLLRRIRSVAAKDAKAHREKFAEATFGADRRNIRSPKASPTVLRPLVEKMLVVALSARYKEKFGKEFNAKDGADSSIDCLLEELSK